MQILLNIMNFACFLFVFVLFFCFLLIFLYFTDDFYPLTIGTTTFNCTLMSIDKAHLYYAWLPAQLASTHASKCSAASV